MAQLFANNASGTLASGIASAGASLTLATGQGALFPSPTAADYFLLTLTQPSGPETSWEIVKVTARSADTLNIVRAQENTTAVSWPGGSKAEARLTAGTMTSTALFADGGDARSSYVSGQSINGGTA